MASRSTSPARSRTASTRPANRRAPARPASRAKAPAKKSAPLPVAAVRGAWMGLAHVTGGTVRKVSSAGHDLEPEHRRVAARDFECVVRGVDRGHARSRAPLLDRERDRAAARAEIDHARRR